MRDDYDMDMRAPEPFLRFSATNRMYVDDRTWIVAPATDQMESILKMWEGEEPSALDDVGTARVAEALSNLLSAALLPRSVALDVSHISEGQRPEFEKQDSWGMLHEWEVVGFGFGKDDDGEPRYAISIFYPDPDAAEADASEFVHRMRTYKASVWEELLQRGYPEHPLVGSEIISTSHASYGDGSTLTVRYTASGPISSWPSAGWYVGRDTPAHYPEPVAWFMLVEMRDLGFLVPWGD